MMFDVKVKTTTEKEITVTITIVDLMKLIEEKCVDVQNADITDIIAVSGSREFRLDEIPSDCLKIMCKKTTVS